MLLRAVGGLGFGLQEMVVSGCVLYFIFARHWQSLTSNHIPPPHKHIMKWSLTVKISTIKDCVYYDIKYQNNVVLDSKNKTLKDIKYNHNTCISNKQQMEKKNCLKVPHPF